MAFKTPSESAAVEFMVAGGLAYEIIAAACSSPQTTEINAEKRSETLMKWVHIGLAQVFVFGVAAAAVNIIGKRSATPVIAGVLVGSGMMYASYIYANNAGLASSEPPTEEY